VTVMIEMSDLLWIYSSVWNQIRI